MWELHRGLILLSHTVGILALHEVESCTVFFRPLIHLTCLYTAKFNRLLKDVHKKIDTISDLLHKARAPCNSLTVLSCCNFCDLHYEISLAAWWTTFQEPLLRSIDFTQERVYHFYELDERCQFSVPP